MNSPKNFDFMMDFASPRITITLTIFGLILIYSSRFNAEGVNISNENRKQIVWAVWGFIIIFVVSLIDYQRKNVDSFYILPRCCSNLLKTSQDSYV